MQLLVLVACLAAAVAAATSSSPVAADDYELLEFQNYLPTYVRFASRRRI